MAVPTDLDRFLHRLAVTVRATVGRNALGLYMYGSLTQGAFETRRSDLDGVVLMQRRPSSNDIRRLRAGLGRLKRTEAWMRRLQLSLLLKRELFQMNGAGWLYQFGRLQRTGSDGNPIVWVNIRESGIIVFGPTPASFLPRITRPLMAAALVRELAYLVEELVGNASSPWRGRQYYRRYAVLTVCRILYTQRTGQIVSKPRAAAWALRTLPAISMAFAEGRLSYSKARALTRVAHLRDEDSLLDYALRVTAPQVEERCRQIRNATPESSAGAWRAWERRSLTLLRDDARGIMRISVELPIEQGALDKIIIRRGSSPR